MPSPSDHCPTCGHHREGALFECPFCGAAPVSTGLPKFQDSYEDIQEHRQLKAAYASLHNKHLILGGLVLLGGCAVTVGSFFMAEPGDHYMVAWGAIAVGAADVIYGLLRTPSQ